MTPDLDERTLRLITRYARPDNRGWVMTPADMFYRLTRWHGVAITREELTEILAAIPLPDAIADLARRIHHSRPAVVPFADVAFRLRQAGHEVTIEQVRRAVLQWEGRGDRGDHPRAVDRGTAVGRRATTSTEEMPPVRTVAALRPV